MIRRAVAALFALAVTGCAPVSILQGAEVLSRGRSLSGIAVSAFLPVREHTFLESDGPGTGRQQDLNGTLLPSVIGWTREGLDTGEFQVGFQVPSFTITLGYKIGLVGAGPGDTHGLSAAVDAGASPVLGDGGAGATLLASTRPAESWRLDLAARYGTAGGLWHRPALTVTLGATLGRRAPWHVQLGVVLDPAQGPILGGDQDDFRDSIPTAPGFFAAVGMWK